MTENPAPQRTILILFLAVAAARFLASAAIGETPPDPPQYDRKTEVAMAGVVREVSDFRCEFGWRGTHLTLDSDRGAILVHVGPASWLQKKRFFLLAGDRIEVTGSLQAAAGTEFLIARMISNQEKILKLRSKRGTPKWSGDRKGWSLGFGVSDRGGATDIP
jgi:hypothetical protein